MFIDHKLCSRLLGDVFNLQFEFLWPVYGVNFGNLGVKIGIWSCIIVNFFTVAKLMTCFYFP